MSVKTNTVLAIIVALAVFWVVKVELPEEEFTARSAQLLADVTVADVEKIVVRSSHGEISFSRLQPRAKTQTTGADSDTIDNENFGMDGVAYRALDASSLNTVWQALRGLRFEKPIPTAEREADLGIYGLTNPSVAVAVTAKGKEFAVELGSSNKFVSKSYARRSGDDGLYLIADSLTPSAVKARDDFRKRMPLDFDDADVSSAELRRGNEVCEVSIDDKRAFRIRKPVNFRASAQAVGDILRETRILRAESYLDDAPASRDGRVVDVALEGAIAFRESSKKAAIEFAILRSAEKRVPAKGKKGGSVDSASAEEFYLTLNGQPGAFRLPRDPSPMLWKSVEQLREKKYMDFMTFAVRSASMRGSLVQGNPILIAASGDEWRVDGEVGDKTFILEYLSAIRETEAVGYLDAGGTYGFDNPLLSIELVFDKDEKRHLTIGRALSKATGDDARYSALSDDGAEPFVINGATLKKLLPKREVLRKTAEEQASSSTTPAD